ncbi:MAG: MerR family transcriptional regulator [Eubacteriales bacterium]
MKPLTINQIANLCGVSVRTLHYYDEIGLLCPSSIADNGYRQYDYTSLEKLQEILFFKELDIPLKDIKEIMENPNHDTADALKKHRELLVLKRERLGKIIALLDDNLKSNKVDLKEFDMTEIKQHIEKYKEEAKQRWGHTDAYKQSNKKTAEFTEQDWKRINDYWNRLFSDFADCMNKKPKCKSVDTLVQQWQSHISENFYECTDEILLGLADMYVFDERFKKNIDKHGENLAEFINESIQNYIKNKG